MPASAIPSAVEDRDAAGRRTAVLVLGMHRSGTSVLTDLLARLGAVPPTDPNPPAPDNPRGYWEPAGLVRLHDQMLSAADSAWLDTRPLDLSAMGAERVRTFTGHLLAALDRSFGTAGLFVLKDPRICRFVPFYRALFEVMGIDPKVVLSLRAPADVAASLFTRNQISADYAGVLWAHHLLDVERHTRDLPRIVVSYETLVSDWRPTARRLAEFMAAGTRAVDLAWVESPFEAALHHHRTAAYDVFSPPLGALLLEIHAVLSRSCEDRIDGARLDALAERLAVISERQADLFSVEFCFQRLTSPYDAVKAPDPLRERRLLAAALERLHRAEPRHHAEPAPR
ncbi:hypothetical protein ASF39_10865 [Methylobacterium sp. Leaf108]|nr:hypothetical protein ASF39_10865 [Methylobacterium sp. Leaf108]